MEISGVEGTEAVIQWWGRWPSFHDAEVVSILLATSGKTILSVRPLYPNKPATVEFILEDITDLELADFSHQNVLFDLHIEKTTDKNGEEVYRIILDDIFGIGGRIDARSVRVQLNHDLSVLPEIADGTTSS